MAASDISIREYLQGAHRGVTRSLPVFTRKHRADRREDVIVTYVDGPAKSGADYARRYAEYNNIGSKCVFEMGDFSAHLNLYEDESNVSIHGIIVVDDIVGTGQSLRDNLTRFLQQNREVIRLRNPPIRIVALCATAEGQTKVRSFLRGQEDLDIDLIVCEPLGLKHFAFAKGSQVWASLEEAETARTLCRKIGSHLEKSTPLGFGEQGLMVVFPQTCPNNSLPILYAVGGKSFPWTPLFLRPRN